MTRLTKELLFVILHVVVVCSGADIPSVNSKLGKINGDRVSTIFGGKTYIVDRYLGIPYAKPPVGERRFKKPEPYGAFEGQLNAVTMPPACPQYEFSDLKMIVQKQSEDCLYLNVYVPKQDPDEQPGHAVMFFIHGGGFNLGASDVYKAEKLASVGNVIVVTINYRLGLLGFLNLRDERARGNFGLWDQQLALQWVNQNIKAFGGDKDRVTVFGQSAGSVSVMLHMFYPQNKGLFTSAIAESGAITMPLLTKDDSIETAKFFAENMSCSVETTDEIFNCLMTADQESIIKVADDAIRTDPMLAIKIATVPTIDGEFIRMRPSEIVKRSQTEKLPETEFFKSVKLINGVNGAEGTMFLMSATNSEEMEEFKLTREEKNTQQVPGIAAIQLGFEAVVPDIVKNLIEYEYTDWNFPDDPKRLRKEMLKAYGDIFFNVPGKELTVMHRNGSDTASYFYNFLPFLELHLLPTPVWVGAANHGDELAAVFGYNFDYENLRNMSKYQPPAWELDLSLRMMTYWSNFAKSGNPNHPKAVQIEWPEYNLDTQKHLIFDREDSTGQYLYARELMFWRNVVQPLYDELTHAQTITAQYTKDGEGTCKKDGTCG